MDQRNKNKNKRQKRSTFFIAFCVKHFTLTATKKLYPIKKKLRFIYAKNM
jgi:hypothetical protein